MPADSRPPHTLLAIVTKTLSRIGQGLIAFLVIHDAIEQEIFITIVITLSIHCLRYRISSELRDLTIRELNLVSTGVLDWIIIRDADQVAVRITLPRLHLPTDINRTSWQKDRCAQILISNLRGSVF